MSMFFTSKMTNMSTGFLKGRKGKALFSGSRDQERGQTDKEASDKINVRIPACTTNLDGIKLIH